MLCPDISVVIPLYNKHETVARALRSVLDQTYQDFEVLVVNDGSTDGSMARVRQFSDPRIRAQEQRHAGASAARNRGIQTAKSEWLAFLDADDEWKRDFLETITGLRHTYPLARLCGTRYEYCILDGTGPRRAAPGFHDCFPGEHGLIADYFRLTTLSSPPICSSAVGVAREAALSVGGFPKGVEVGEDLLFWARLAARFPIAYSKRICATYHKVVWERDLHRRLPAIPDLVATGLEEIVRQESETPRASRRRFLAHWYDMRASMWLQYGKPCNARRDALSGAGIGGMTAKRALFLGLSLLPAPILAVVLHWRHAIGHRANQASQEDVEG